MTIHVSPGADLVRRSFTADDVRRMVEAGILDEDERVELIDGELLSMASKGFAHDLVKNKLTRRIVRSLSDHFYVAVESTLQLSPSVLVEPDVLVCREDALAKSPEGFVTLEGSVILLLVEVAVSSMAYDRGRKAALYARYGIPEYWVVDANERTAWVHREPGPEGYGSVVEESGGAVLHPANRDLADLAISLTELR